MLVTIGVAGELFADGGIFLFSRHLQTIAEQEIAELTKVAGTAADAAVRAKASADEAKQKADAISKQADDLTLRMKNASRELGILEKNIADQGPRRTLLLKIAPELTKQLAAFAGQRAMLVVCGRQGLVPQEMLNTWGAIADMLDTAGAKWKLVHGNLNFSDRCGLPVPRPQSAS